MKKTILNSFAILSLACLTACLGTTSNTTGSALAPTPASNTNAGNVGAALLSSALGGGNQTTNALSNAGAGILGGVLSQLLGTKTNVNNIYGTWVYAQPKVTFESENVLAQIGSSVASSKIESTLQGQLTKMGFTAGKTSMTFKQDGTCTMTLGSQTTPGTYTYNAANGTMTIKGALGVATVTPYVSVMGGEMYMLFDADKLLGVFTGLSSQTTYTSTLSSLLKNYSGLKLGWKMTKK